MLLVVVHANGSYFPHEGENIPPFEMPPDFHESLAALTGEHVKNGQKAAYLPFWFDPLALGVHYEKGLQQEALSADPYYQALEPEVAGKLTIIPDGAAREGDGIFVRTRDHLLDLLALGDDRVCFVGAYAGACVLDRAVSLHDRLAPSIRPYISIDLDHCVDISSQPVNARIEDGIELAPYASA